jgi:hypothetical protein
VKVRKRAAKAALVSLAVFAGAAGVALATQSVSGTSTADATTINGCMKTANGQLRAVPAGEACLPSETALRWSVQGVKGDTGSPGPVGPQGPVGANGATGLSGPTGPAGPQGLKGEAGPSGAQGIKGDDGAVGPAGPQGLKGDPGATGLDGAPGSKGDPGDVGATGPTGATGPQGDAGVQGPAGTGGEGPYTLVPASALQPGSGSASFYKVATVTGGVYVTAWCLTGEYGELYSQVRVFNPAGSGLRVVASTEAFGDLVAPGMVSRPFMPGASSHLRLTTTSVANPTAPAVTISDIELAYGASRPNYPGQCVYYARTSTDVQ